MTAMADNITVEEALYLMPSLTPVKVIFESGCFFSGSKYKVLRQLSPQQKELKVSKILNTMIPLPFKINLVKQTLLFCGG